MQRISSTNAALFKAMNYKQRLRNADRDLHREQQKMALLLVQQIQEHAEMNRGINATSLKLSEKLTNLISVAKYKEASRQELTARVMEMSVVLETINHPPAIKILRKYQHLEEIATYLQKLSMALRPNETFRIPAGFEIFCSNVKKLSRSTFLSRLLLSIGLITALAAVVILTQGAGLPWIMALCEEPAKAASILGALSFTSLMGGASCHFFSRTLRNQLQTIYKLIKEMVDYQENTFSTEASVLSQTLPANDEKSFPGVESTTSILYKAGN